MQFVFDILESETYAVHKSQFVKRSFFMDAEEKKGWNLIQLFLWMIQFGAEFWLMFRIWKLNMLPGIFMGIVI